MAKGEDDGLVVEIDPRQLDMRLEPETERKAKAKDDEVVEEREPEEKKSSGSDEAIEALQKQLDALKEENARNRAAYELKAREADDALSTAHHASGRAMQSQYDLVNTEIANGKARQEAIKREMKIARETGDTDRETDLINESARVGVRLQTNEERKAHIEAQHREEQARREAKRSQPADPFEASLQGLSPKSQAWLRSHPECVTDDVMNAKVLLADKEARRKGFAADTPEYFSYIEEQMGYRQPRRDEDDGEVETRRSDKSDRRQSYAAPPSRDSAPGAPLKPTQKRLSREQVETAEAMGMTPSQYAAWMVKVERDGKYANN